MALQKKEIQSLVQEIQNAQSITLTTHKNCDPDGLGSVLAMHEAFQSMGKKIQSLSVDEISKRHDFMKHQGIIQVYSKNSVKESDLALIFDTNDPSYVEPLYSELTQKTKKQIFIDHHCPVQNSKSLNLFIDENAASTGELCHALLEEIKAPMTKDIARSLYISIIFDTHMFRSSKNLSQSFYTSSKLCQYVDANEIYDELFCQYNQKNWKDSVALLQQVQFNNNQSIAFIECSYDQFQKNSINVFHILDALDWVMKMKSVLIGFVSVEKKPGLYKLSFRSKKNIDVATLAESLGGGGHKRSAGASVKDYSREKILALTEQILSS